MRYLLSLLPIVLVLALMIRWRWGAHRAGIAGLLAGLLLAWWWFGLTPKLLWISQAKGLLLSLFVLAVMWPALFLYHWVDQSGGITAIAKLLERAVPNRGMCLILLAWALSGLLEGLAGFGIPIAVVAPILVALEVPPLQAVAAVAVGHAWAVTFGDMGVILQTLSAVVSLEPARLVPWAALLLGIACLLCGLICALILKELRHWPKIAALAAVMGLTQYVLATVGLLPLSAFGAGLAGLLAYGGPARALRRKTTPDSTLSRLAAVPQAPTGNLSGSTSSTTLLESSGVSVSSTGFTRPAILALVAYGSLTVLMAALTLIGPVRHTVQEVAWKPQFPAITSTSGFTTPTAPGQVFRPFSHPGTLILVVALGCIVGFSPKGTARSVATRATRATVSSAGKTSIGIVSMVGLSTLMDHSGMSDLLAQGLCRVLGSAYPLVSPWVGILGAFATGSNNNSNVLFGSLQKNVALRLHLNTELLVSAQTAGGSLGSMLAPAKIIVGCSTVGQAGREGEVLRRTVPWGLALGLAIGVVTFILSR